LLLLLSVAVLAECPGNIIYVDPDPAVTVDPAATSGSRENPVSATEAGDLCNECSATAGVGTALVFIYEPAGYDYDGDGKIGEKTHVYYSRCATYAPPPTGDLLASVFVKVALVVVAVGFLVIGWYLRRRAQSV
jgi:hypothetical protein